MKFKILCVGKIKESFYIDEIKDICMRIKRSGHEIDIIEIPDIKIPDNIKDDRIEGFLEKECEPMRKKIEKQDYVVALCIEGRELGSSKHRKIINDASLMGKDVITYVIGGSLGLPRWVKEQAALKLSFSKMTFPHQLMRVVLLEEIENMAAGHL